MIAEPKVIPTMIGLKRTKPITLNQRHNPQGRNKAGLYIQGVFFFLERYQGMSVITFIRKAKKSKTKTSNNNTG